MGFRNFNKPESIGWDHVCAKPCADQYTIAPLEAAAPSTIETVAVSASGAGQPSSSRQRSDDDGGKTPYYAMASKLNFTLREATSIVEECGGNFDRATHRLGDLWLQSFSDADDDDLPDADGSNDDHGGSSGEEETLPERPLARSVAPSTDFPFSPLPNPPTHPYCPTPALPLVPPLHCPPPLHARPLHAQPHPPLHPTHPYSFFGSNDARSTAADVFFQFIKPMLPKPQTDGSFKDGDPGLMDMLMPTPLTLNLPRAERLADLIRPNEGWDQESLLRARSFFSLSAAGTGRT